MSDTGIAPACGCGASTPKPPPQYVYALGQLGYDFGIEARRDAFIQKMDEPVQGTSANPHDPDRLLVHLERNPWDAASVIWTLNLDGTPIYAIRPQGPFAGEAFLRLRQFLKGQLPPEGIERISIPGVIAGKVRLLNGQVLPVIAPEISGMYSWTTRALVQAVVGDALPDSGEAAQRRHGRANAEARRTRAVTE